MGTVRQSAQSFLQRRDIDVRRYRRSIPARRQRILAYHAIDLLVDVGANIGQYASAVRRSGYRGRILSIEPVREPFEELQAVATRDAMWEVRRTALGAEAGTVTMQVSKRSVFSSVLQPLGAANEASDGVHVVSHEDVPITTLDELVPDSERRIAVKIDVQGFEREVLDGGPRVLANASVVEMELSPRPLYDKQMLMVEAIERMEKLGLFLSLTENLWVNGPSGKARQFNGIFSRD